MEEGFSLGTISGTLKAPPGFEPGVADLQSAALPLGEGAGVPMTPVVSAARLARLESWEAPPGFEPGMADLQSAALPLG
jgi:hypothetical protein